MRMTLKRLAEYCACYDCYAEIDADNAIARCYMNGGDNRCVAIIWLA